MNIYEYMNLIIDASSVAMLSANYEHHFSGLL